MRFLKIIGIRIALGSILSNMAFDLAAPNLATTVLSVLLRIIVAGVFYYLITIYVNSKKSL